MKNSLKPKSLPLILVLLVFPLSAALALDSVFVKDGSGKPMFQLNYYTPAEADKDASHWYVVDDGVRSGVLNAAQAWADILGSYSKNTTPVTISILGEHDDNAGATSPDVVIGRDDSRYTSVGALIIEGVNTTDPDDDSYASNNATITLGDWPSFSDPGSKTSFYSDNPITVLPHNGDKLPTSVVMFHEIGHALGLSASRDAGEYVADDGTERLVWFFGDENTGGEINQYTSHLVDSRGVRAEAGMPIFQKMADAEWALQEGLIDNLSEAFITDDDKLYFVGNNLTSVLRGAFGNKAPINGWERTRLTDGTPIWFPEFSHLEFTNSLMSHQGYRNTGVFFEAELAIMQDIGYDIDRKNFYGLSIYNDGETIVNNQGFFARNADGTAYLEGVHNQTNNTIGLHVFGSGNHVAQAADILAAGYGSMGVRVDGEGNTVVIGRNTRVESLGDYGIGVGIAYGKDQILNHQGAIKVEGENARGVSFDFGSNIMTDRMVHLGSYIHTTQEYNDATEQFDNWILGNMDEYPTANGAMVERFDMSGTIIAQNKATEAIYIAQDTHVKNVNILSGAYIVGDISSHWDPSTDQTTITKHTLQLDDPDADFKDYITNLTFGLAKDRNGNAIADRADDNFHMTYDGKINGEHSIAMTVAGGILEYNGAAKIISLHNESGATLAGAGEITVANIAGDQQFKGRNDYANNFVNDGVIAPGNADNTTYGTMTIALEDTTSFINEGTIQIGFDQQGNHDILEIAGVSGSTVDMNGTTEMRAIAGYYASGAQLNFNTDDMIQIDSGIAATGENGFDASSFSPTIDFTFESTADGVSVLASRNENSYAQFANDKATQTVGHELWRISYLGDDMPDSFSTVLAGLDMAGGGKGVERGLNQLMPHFANVAAQQSLDNQRVISNALLSRLFPSVTASCQTGCVDPCAPSPSGVRVFATAIGGGGKQDGKGYGVPGYSYWSTGVLTGVEVERGGVTGGVHIAMNHWKQRGSGGSGDKNRANAFSFGLHGSAAPADWNGGYLFALARGTIERNHMNRAVNLVTGRSVNTSKWTGWSGNAVLGGGFDLECGAFRFGPMAGLDYAVNHRRSVSESGRFGLLDIESGTYNSFRAMAGFRAAGMVGARTSVSGTARWNYEMLDKTGTTRAKFSGVGVESFSSRARYPGRNSLTVSLGLKHALTARAALEIEGGGEFFRGGHASGWGSASIAWQF